MTRASILALAIEKVRPSAQLCMQEAVLQFHEGKIDLLECPTCLFGNHWQRYIALTPCADTFCAECIVNILDGASSMYIRSQGPLPTMA
jgi:hypothetical protein